MSHEGGLWQDGFLGLAPLLLILSVIRLRTGRRIDLRRSVLLAAPAEIAWEYIRHLPTLLVRHGQIRTLGSIDECRRERGDEEGIGSVWRGSGRWGSRPYWVEMEIVRLVPGREVGIRLVRDSLGTHRGVRHHLGTLTVEPAGEGNSKLTWRLRADLRSVRLRLYRLLKPERLAMRLLDIGLRSVKVGIDRARREDVESAPRGSSAGLAADPDARVPDTSSAPLAAPDAFDRPPEYTG